MKVEQRKGLAYHFTQKVPDALPSKSAMIQARHKAGFGYRREVNELTFVDKIVLSRERIRTNILRDAIIRKAKYCIYLLRLSVSEQADLDNSEALLS